jgi:4-hydroxybenzoate polyprenyltransferase
LTESLGRAVPFLFIAMCTFIANDLDDLERDKVNHPNRPLPAGKVTVAFAVVLYFTCLALALFSTKYYVEQGVDFWYYGLISLSISYVYIVNGLPGLKTIYVATALTIPVLMMATLYPNDPRLYVLAGASFLSILGRELCGVIQDRAGDVVSFMHRIDPKPLAIIAFSLQAVGLFLAATQIRELGDAIALLAMIILYLLSCLFWFKLGRDRLATALMKIQFFFGLYLLT